MARSFYHTNPDTLTLATDVVDAVPGRVLMAEQPFFPGGGGQLGPGQVAVVRRRSRDRRF